MASQLGSKLIWQGQSPAPFESAWLIFAKLQVLNPVRPMKIRSLIVDQTRSDASKGDLEFRDSSWIDFERFGNTLGVDESRLRAAFLDQLGFVGQEFGPHRWGGPGIKVCPDCLAKGYHSVFFELGFIDICPWHYRKLEAPCYSCRSTVLYSGFKKRKVDAVGDSAFETIEWMESYSSCKHILFQDGRVGKSNGLSRAEEDAITTRCAALLEWWKVASGHPEIAAFLSRYSFNDHEEQRLRIFFGAAERIAGKCPWPVSIARDPVRTHRWTECKDDDAGAVGGRAARATEWDTIYRSVRRHIFSRYVRHHRDCWNELSNYRCYDARRLDSSTCCPVSLAYVVWKMTVEYARNIEALKSGRLRANPIMAMKLYYPQHANSLRAHASLLYAYFFSIWGEILRHAGVDSFAIQQAGEHWSQDFLIALFSQNVNSTRADAGEWTVVFPDHRYLQRRSFTSCCGRAKCRYWMISGELQEHWTDIWWGDEAVYGQPLFRLRKSERGQVRATYNYICI